MPFSWSTLRLDDTIIEKAGQIPTTASTSATEQETATEYVSVNGVQLPWFTESDLKGSSDDQLREHAELVYNTIGASKIGVPVPESQVEILAWIPTVQRLHLERHRGKTEANKTTRPSPKAASERLVGREDLEVDPGLTEVPRRFGNDPAFHSVGEPVRLIRAEARAQTKNGYVGGGTEVPFSSETKIQVERPIERTSPRYEASQCVSSTGRTDVIETTSAITMEPSRLGAGKEKRRIQIIGTSQEARAQTMDVYADGGREVPIASEISIEVERPVEQAIPPYEARSSAVRTDMVENISVIAREPSQIAATSEDVDESFIEIPEVFYADMLCEVESPKLLNPIDSSKEQERMEQQSQDALREEEQQSQDTLREQQQSQQQAELGLYQIVNAAIVREGFEPDSREITDLHPQEIIHVLEIKDIGDRVRARIESPPGWISLINKTTDVGFAVKVPDLEPAVEAESIEPIPHVPEVVVENFEVEFSETPRQLAAEAFDIQRQLTPEAQVLEIPPTPKAQSYALGQIVDVLRTNGQWAPARVTGEIATQSKDNPAGYLEVIFLSGAGRKQFHHSKLCEFVRPHMQEASPSVAPRVELRATTKFVEPIHRQGKMAEVATTYALGQYVEVLRPTGEWELAQVTGNLTTATASKPEGFLEITYTSGAGRKQLHHSKLAEYVRPSQVVSPRKVALVETVRQEGYDAPRSARASQEEAPKVEICTLESCAEPPHRRREMVEADIRSKERLVEVHAQKRRTGGSPPPPPVDMRRSAASGLGHAVVRTISTGETQWHNPAMRGLARQASSRAFSPNQMMQNGAVSPIIAASMSVPVNPAALGQPQRMKSRGEAMNTAVAANSGRRGSRVGAPPPSKALNGIIGSQRWSSIGTDEISASLRMTNVALPLAAQRAQSPTIAAPRGHPTLSNSSRYPASALAPPQPRTDSYGGGQIPQPIRSSPSVPVQFRRATAGSVNVQPGGSQFVPLSGAMGTAMPSSASMQVPLSHRRVV